MSANNAGAAAAMNRHLVLVLARGEYNQVDQLLTTMESETLQEMFDQLQDLAERVANKLSERESDALQGNTQQ